jgi:ABC-type nitrate/sulfonate/bicarbonate transport system substrate-binding protein
MHASRRRFAALGLVLASLLLSRPALAADLKKLRFGLSAGTNTAVQPALYAQSSGLFRKYGLDVEFVNMNDDPTAVQGLIANAFEMLYAGAGPGLVAATRGADFKIVSSFTPVSDSLFVASNSITSLKQMEGKVLAVSKIGSLSYIMSTVALLKEGVDVEKVHMLAAGNDTAKAQMVAAGRVDGTTLNGIGTAPLLGPGSKVHVIYDVGASLHDDLVNTVVFARGDLIRAHPDIVEAAVKALMEASRALQSDKDLAIHQAVSTGLPDAGIRTTYDHLFSMGIPYYGVDGGLDVKTIAATIQVMKQSGIIDQPLPVEKVLDLSFVQEALQSLGPYRH